MQAHQRIYALDNLRGVAILAMIVYHFYFDLSYFNIISNRTLPQLAQLTITFFAILFVFLAGVTQSISQNILIRSLKLFIYATLITVVTYILIPSSFVSFGILHLLTTLTFITFLLKRNYFLSLLIFGIFLFLRIFFKSYSLIILGFPPLDFTSIDYYPLWPWAIPFFIGFYLSQPIINYLKNLFINVKFPLFSTIGKHSLTIYLIHQPIIFTIILICSKIHNIWNLN